MAKRVLNLTERNFPNECIVGQANGTPIQGLRDGTIYNRDVAVVCGDLVGIKPDGLFYLASAEVGAGQLRAAGWVFQSEAANGQAIDVMRAELTLRLDSAVASALPGQPAYLSPTAPGQITAVKPVTTGQLVQQVGIFITSTMIKMDVENIASVV